MSTDTMLADPLEPITIVTSAFSLNMLAPGETLIELDVRRLTLDEFRDDLVLRPWESAVFREDFARILSNMVGMRIPHVRRSVQLHPHVRLLVAQYNGPKTNPGEDYLPPNGQVTFYEVKPCDWGVEAKA